MEREQFIEKLSQVGSESDSKYLEFKRLVLAYYRAHGRSFPWRETRDPYAILVSEIMLQQTQTDRVLPKYRAFMESFPDWKTLARVPTKQVLEMWTGLGYYRRALNLQKTARVVVEELDGVLPRTVSGLVELPGIGSYTAAAVSVFAFGVSVPMIETNIRSVYLQAFFHGREDVRDQEILSVIEQSIYTRDPRRWFYALMDFGVALKRAQPGINKRSKHYAVQSPYEGSTRQIRASVLKFLTARPSSSSRAIQKNLNYDEARVSMALESLVRDGFLVREARGRYTIA